MTIDARSAAILMDQLGAEHAELIPWTEKVMEAARSNSPQLTELVARQAGMLGQPLDSHIVQEDTVLFPAFAKETGDEGLVGQFSEEHRELLALRDEMLTLQREGAPVEKLADVASQFADLLNSHMTREDHVLFPSARHALC
jgi:hemerythrin-like domain-containing protein